ncbi:MAG: carbamoyltransferase HypF [Arenicellales bacterium]
MKPSALHITITGKVQGVGFRPFIYRLAHQLSLSGSVRNCTGQVEIHIQGPEPSLEQFCSEIIPAAPAVSQPHIQSLKTVSAEECSDFIILASENSDDPQIHIPTDYFTCPDCLVELRGPNERRFHYPFINCTQCGPRYTIINKLPYDRPSTSMSGFPLCDACRKEYENPLDRRFHAQPLACPDCGPALHFHDKNHDLQDTQQALAASINALRDGKIVAVKGIGGYHLLCDAQNDQAISHLRQQKPRPDKPLAVMFPERGNDGLTEVRLCVDLAPVEAELLHSPSRPIVLAQKKSELLSALIAPGLNEIGIMLPYSPLHYLLLDVLDKPVVATSANISGEPVLTDNAEVEKRLSHVAQAFLHHNREIVRPADDPVYRTIVGTPRPLRMGRGNAPVEIDLPFTLVEPILATGSHMKNTVALAWENRLVISPHIGDLDSPRSQQVFKQVIDDLQQLYQVKAATVICDAHPMYASSRWAEQCGLPVTRIFHHRAHASALVLDHWKDEDWLIFTWDGVGYGEDASLWGGEALFGQPGSWQRVASMNPFYLPGGEKAGREPWRSAAALCWQADVEWADLPTGAGLAKQAWEKRLNSPQSTAVGRLFDAAAALTGLLQQASFEGQGPMLLEQASSKLRPCAPLPQAENADGLLQADWSGLLPLLMDNRRSIADRASHFHACLAHTLLQQALTLRQRHGVKNIGLCGGVFQNKKLSDYAAGLLQENGFTACLPLRLPANDAAICAGQVVEAAKSQTA